MLYQHFKGGLYVVSVGVAHDATNGSERALVVYSSISDGNYYCREHTEFHENVEYEGKTGPRFRVITDAADIMPEGGHP